MVDFAQMLVERNKEKEWAATDLGKAFWKLMRTTEAYWQKDSDLRVSDKRLRELSDAQRAAQKNFLLLLRGW